MSLLCLKQPLLYYIRSKFGRYFSKALIIPEGSCIQFRLCEMFCKILPQLKPLTHKHNKVNGENPSTCFDGNFHIKICNFNFSALKGSQARNVL